MTTHAMSLRMPEELMTSVALIADVEKTTMTAVLIEAVERLVDQRQAAPAFRKLVEDRIAADKRLLETLAVAEGES